MMAEEDRARHTLTNCSACPIGDDQQMYLMLRCNKLVERGHQEPAQQQPHQPRRVPAAVPQQQVPDPQGLFTEMFKELLTTTPNMAIGASCRDICRSIEKTFNGHTKNFEHSTKLHDALQPKKQTILIKSQKSKRYHHSRSTSLCKNTKRRKTTSIIFTLGISQKEVTRGRD